MSEIPDRLRAAYLAAYEQALVASGSDPRAYDAGLAAVAELVLREAAAMLEREGYAGMAMRMVSRLADDYGDAARPWAESSP